LENGRAEVALDPDFAATVDSSDYQVFLTSYGPTCLYVAHRRSDGFEVRAIPGFEDVANENLNALTSAFGYRVLAARKGVPGRFERVQIPDPMSAEPLSPSDWERLRPSGPIDAAGAASAAADEVRRQQQPE